MRLDVTELNRIVESAIGNQMGSERASTPVFDKDNSISGVKSLLGKVQPPPGKKFKVTVESVEGLCVCNHKVGEVFYIENDKTPEGICIPAFAGLLPYINAMICNADFWWEPVRGKIRLGCPDPDNHVTFCIELV